MACGFMMLQFLILISYIAGPDLTFSLNATRGECVVELDDTCDGGQLFIVLKCGDLHLVITEVVPVGGNADEKADFISIKLTLG